MTRQVLWSRSALDDLQAQIAFIARDDRAAALRVADAIRDAGAGLGARPAGQPGRVAGTYEKSVSRLPYVIAYAIAPASPEERVVILRVIHTARDWPSEGWPE